MAERKPIVIISGLLQELNVGTDKISFSGNSTTDLPEGTNLYFTNARARGAVSVTDSGGQGSLAYNSSTGVITYTGPSDSDVRGTLSVASGSGLTYNSGTGEFGTSAISNSQLANDDVTIGSTAVALGATASTITGLTSLASGTLIAGVEDAANAIEIGSGNIIFEGSTADTNEIILTAADATGSDKTITLPNATGTVALLSTLSVASSSGLSYDSSTGEFSTNAIPNAQLANSSVTVGSTSIALGGSSTTITGLTTLTVGTTDAANSIKIDDTGNITFEGSTADTNETILTAADATGGDKTLTLPNETGTILSTASSIANSNLANSTVTVGTTGIALGSSATTIVGLTSITSNAVVTNDDGFRIRDNSDNTKQVAFECSGITGSTTRTLTIPDASGTIALVGGGTTVFADDVFRVTDNSDASKKLAFECSGISGSTTRTMTVPNENGTISTESFATAIAVALG